MRVKHYLFSIWCRDPINHEDVCVMSFDDGDSFDRVFRIADKLDELGVCDVKICFESFYTEENDK